MKKGPRFPPKLAEVRAENARWLQFMDGGRKLDITQQAIDAVPPKRVRGRPPALDMDRVGAKKAERSVNQDLAAIKFDGMLYRNNRGALSLGNGKFMRYGVGPNGAGDWIGWRSIVVTAEMIGKRLAVFVNLEAKAPGGRIDPAQHEFNSTVKKAGGIAGIAHSGDEAMAILGVTDDDK